MADKGSAPFPRGETFYGLAGTIDTSDYGGSTFLEGRSHTFPNTNPSNKQVRLSGLGVEVICVRNTSGIHLLPGFAVSWAAGYRGQRVDGSPTSDASEIAGIVDDHLSHTNGVRNGDLFWLITRGPCLVHVPISQYTAWVENDLLYSQTAATSQITSGATNNCSAGRLVGWGAEMTVSNSSGATLWLGSYVRNSVGRVMSGATADETATTTLKKIHLNILGGP